MVKRINKQAILQSAKEQLAMEYGCNSAAFDNKDNTIILAEDDHFFKIATFGMGAVIMANESIYPWCVEKLSDRESEDILDGSILFNIEKKLREHGKQLAGLHARYLFWPNRLKIENETGYKIQWYESEEIPSLYHDKRFGNALSYKENKDVLAVAAFDGNQIVSLAGADNYKKNLWQIGIDTIQSNRNKGIATYLVHLLASEIRRRGFIPYYTTWSANLASTKVALNSGFFPAWVEYFSENTEK